MRHALFGGGGNSFMQVQAVWGGQLGDISKWRIGLVDHTTAHANGAN